MKAKTDVDMKRSWLVQRLEKPHAGFGKFGMDNPFSFGGGRKNGGLSDEAMSLLRKVFSFDYMGAAEFEYGAVPEALQRVATAKDLSAWSFSIPLKQVAPDWRDKTPRVGDAIVYVLAPDPTAAEVEQRIRGWAKEPYGGLKEPTGLARVLRPPADDPYPSRVCGWLELDNGFFFFTDEVMWKATAALFGVAAGAPDSSQTRGGSE